MTVSAGALSNAPKCLAASPEMKLFQAALTLVQRNHYPVLQHRSPLASRRYNAQQSDIYDKQ